MASHKFPVLDGLRAISILLVLSAHLLPLGPKAFQLNEAIGAVGMSIFFALSGFLITSGLLRRPSIVEFVTRRLVRILPLAYVYTIVVFLGITYDPAKLVWTDLFVVNYLTEYLNALNGHFWSLCVEMQFYLAIAVTVAVLGPKRLWLIWPLCILITLIRIRAGAQIDIQTHLRVDEILSGASVALLYHYASTSLPKSSALKIAVAAVLLMVSAHPSAGALQYFRPYAAAALMLLTLEYGRLYPGGWLESGLMRYVATTSYALYIIHPATTYGWLNEGSSAIRYLLKRPISLLLTFTLAHVSTFYWERHWQNAAKRWLQRFRSSPLQAAEKRI